MRSALDRVIARCLAKNPWERFASFEELVQSLYPYTRSRPRAGASPDAKRSWWMQPSRHQDVWLVAAAGLLLAASLQVPHALHERFGNPPPPARSHYHPGVPYEAFSYTPQTVAAAPESHAPAITVPAKENNASSPHMIHPGKIALASLNIPENPQEHLPNQSANPLRLSQSHTPAN